MNNLDALLGEGLRGGGGGIARYAANAPAGEGLEGGGYGGALGLLKRASEWAKMDGEGTWVPVMPRITMSLDILGASNLSSGRAGNVLCSF